MTDLTLRTKLASMVSVLSDLENAIDSAELRYFREELMPLVDEIVLDYVPGMEDANEADLPAAKASFVLKVLLKYIKRTVGVHPDVLAGKNGVEGKTVVPPELRRRHSSCSEEAECERPYAQHEDGTQLENMLAEEEGSHEKLVKEWEAKRDDAQLLLEEIYGDDTMALKNFLGPYFEAITSCRIETLTHLYSDDKLTRLSSASSQSNAMDTESSNKRAIPYDAANDNVKRQKKWRVTDDVAV